MTVYLLPKGQLLLQDFATFSLYEYLAVKETTRLSRAALDDECRRLWVFSIEDCILKPVIELFRIGDLTRVVVSTHWSLSYFLIEDGSSPAVVEIMQLPAKSSMLKLSLGLGCAVIIERGHSKPCHLITYALADGGDESIGLPFSVSKSPQSRLRSAIFPPIMDEDTGRVVISMIWFPNRETLVFDFSLVKKNQVDASTL